MSVHTLGSPSQFRDRLQYALPRQRGVEPFISVTPRGADERRCAAWSADHYEVNAYYVTSDVASLGPLEDALRAVPGVYLTTKVHPAPRDTAKPGHRPGNMFTNPDWPPALGSRRRDRDDLRVQVIVLIRDEV